MADLKLKFSCLKYVHVKPLMDGTLKPEGIELEPFDLDPSETFPRLLGKREFDVSEMGLSFYIGTLQHEDPPFIAIPVFTSRGFRHNTIYVNAASGITTPRDLIGKNVGELLTYGHDAGTWSKGILSDEYGIPADSYTYFLGGVNRPVPATLDWLPMTPPPNVRYHRLGATQTLNDMLVSGEIDALFSATTPQSLVDGSPKVCHLFDDPDAREREYFQRTHIHPIMHTVVVRRDLYRQHPWIVTALMRAFETAKTGIEDYYRSHSQMLHRLLMIPWLTSLYEANAKLMGDDPWPYGLEPNRATLETFLRYHHEQGNSKRLFRPEELFAPEALA